MTVVERRERNGFRDQFPVGMRVLAVDDDPTCLKVLETLLLRCQYHVTSTNQAIKALKMLRENRDQFDLVISDVHMPDMDGFKLLELVGLEMDLPVIMLSANGETQAVMKGITHGACDYLIKPVRLEELQNIWQHVIRRKKFDPRDQNNMDGFANSEGAGSSGNGSFDDAKFNRKRKDQNEEDEDEDDREANSNENEDPSTQKKTRVVWSIELHRKFVAIVNQLGIDKAVPKRILDLMNVEGLTRENVASHLQKYRLYLKRLNAVANQQACMVAALRSRDPSYLPMGSLDGYTNFNSPSGNRQLPCSTSSPSNGAVPRLNSLTGFGLHGYVPSGNSQLNRTLNNTSSSVNDVAKLQGIDLQTLQRYQQGALVQGMPSSFANSTKSHHLLQAKQQQMDSLGLSYNTSVKIPSLSSDPFGIFVGGSSHSVDPSRCTETWQGFIPSTSFSANTVSMINHNGPSSSNFGDAISPAVSQLRSNPRNISCSSIVMTRFTDPDPLVGNNTVANSQNQATSLLSTRGVSGDANLLSFKSFDNSSQNQSLTCNTLSNSSMPNSHTRNQNFARQAIDNGFSNKDMNMPIIGQPRFDAPFTTQNSESEDTATGGQLHYKDEPFSRDMKLQGMTFGAGGFGLDDIVGNAIIKQEHDDFGFVDDDLGCSDIYSLGACM